MTDAHTSTNANVPSAGGSATLVLLSILVSLRHRSEKVDVDVFLATNTGDDVFIKNVPAGSRLKLLVDQR